MNKFKNIKKLFLALLLGCFALGHAKPLPPGKLPTRAIFNPRAGLSILLDQIARQANQAFLDRMEQIPQFTSEPDIPSPQPLPQPELYSPEDIPSFQVQISPSAYHSATAFSMEVDEEPLMFMATHVAEDIKEDPYLKIKVSDEEYITVPIKNWFTSDKKGLNITVFEPPEEVRKYLSILHPAKKMVEPGTPVTISGFAREHPTILSEEPVLFSSSLRYLIQQRHPGEKTGMCGSPVQDARTGEVVGIFVKAKSLSSLRLNNWFNLLPQGVQKKFTDVYYAVPIQHAVAVARAFKTGNKDLAAIEMKVLGMPVAPLYPNEHIFSVSLLRNGFVQKIIHANPLLNPEELGEFFGELKPNDVVRVAVKRSATSTTKEQTIHYSLNVSTGEVTSFVE